MHPIIARTRRLLERARWKDSDWDKPTPPEVLERYARDAATHGVHMSEVGPGQEVSTPAEAPETDASAGDTNPHVDVEPQTSVEFTSPQPVGGFKVGINPLTAFNTPVGLYAYPLNKDTYDRWFGNRDQPPFAAGRPWMYIVRSEASQRREAHIDASGRVDGFGERGLIDVAENLLAGKPSMVADAIRADTGQGDLDQHGLEEPLKPTDIRAFTDTAFYRDAMADARVQTPFGQMWNLTRLVAKHGGKGPSTWRRLLVEHAAYDVVVDHGSSIVHKNEPTQMVFLAPRGDGWSPEAAVQNVWEWRDEREQRQTRASLYQSLQPTGIDVSKFLESFDVEFGKGVEPEKLGEMIAEQPSGFTAWIDEMVKWNDASNASIRISSHHFRIKEAILRDAHFPEWFLESSAVLQGCAIYTHVFPETITSLDKSAGYVFQGCYFEQCLFRVDESTLESAAFQEPEGFEDLPRKSDIASVLREVLNGRAFPPKGSREQWVAKHILKASDDRVHGPPSFDHCELEIT